MCNYQLNLIDDDWFGYKNVFNVVDDKEKTWKINKKKIKFINNKTWEDYVLSKRLEISCGEGPYLVSRYDTVTGEVLKVEDRIGILDRKIRVINENVKDEKEWYDWVLKAYKSTYGYEWQGDNLLLARENLLYTFRDYYKKRFKKQPEIEKLHEIAEIISWNLWQMDGLKFVVPMSCKTETVKEQETIFTIMGLEVTGTIEKECIGCKKGDNRKHNGIYCKIMDWDKNKGKGKQIKFIDLISKKWGRLDGKFK